MYEEQKEKILKMLNKHYKIDKNVELFIRAIANNEEELQDFQISALAIMGNEREFKNYTVSIKTITSPLMLVKAIKEVCNLCLKEAKDIVDLMIEKKIFTIDEFSITAQQWKEIANMCKNVLQWEYQDFP